MMGSDEDDPRVLLCMQRKGSGIGRFLLTVLRPTVHMEMICFLFPVIFTGSLFLQA